MHKDFRDTFAILIPGKTTSHSVFNTKIYVDEDCSHTPTLDVTFDGAANQYLEVPSFWFSILGPSSLS